MRVGLTETDKSSFLTSVCNIEADIFSGIPRNGKQNRYESPDWDRKNRRVGL